jgi:membrane protease YdiL (CAAX protease family)
MSNPLCASQPTPLLSGMEQAWRALARAAGGAASRPAATSAAQGLTDTDRGPHFLIVVLALGTLVFLGLLFWSLARPSELSLRRAPGRRNSVSVLYLAMILLPWLLIQVGLSDLLRRAWSVLPPAAGSAKPTAAVLQIAVITALVSAVFMAGASLLVAARTFHLGLRTGLGLSTRHWVYDSLRAVVCCLAVIPVTVALKFGVDFLLAPWPEMTQPHVILEAVKELPAPWVLGAFTGAALAVPLAEELFFRGLVQSMFRHYLDRPWPAVAIASAFWALMHAQNIDTMPSLLVLGLVLGFLYERSGRLVAPMIVHALFNALSMIVEMFGRGGG